MQEELSMAERYRLAARFLVMGSCLTAACVGIAYLALPAAFRSYGFILALGGVCTIVSVGVAIFAPPEGGA